ncbi:MAG: calcium/sodium antiporter [Xanthomonadales bacterium]|nr:calcium/sodium antiporter [Xanthomonadales bacterium]
MALQLGWFLLGLLVLGLGADVFVRGASGLAVRFGISPFVVGLVIVGFGTSTPELAVNLSAASRGTTDIALGNIVGSNIANVGVILGISALVAPLAVHMRMLRIEVPIMLGASALLWLLALDGRIARWEGLVMFGGFCAFLVFLLQQSRLESAEVKAELAAAPQPTHAAWTTVMFIVGGLALLMLGSDLCVDAAIVLARLWGMSELLIGLTIVAIGTSLPELASSVAAAWRGQSDLAIGNVIGSNIYNILFILGVTAMILPLPVARSLEMLEIPAMMAFALVLYPMMRGDLRISRAEGAFLLAGYAALVGLQVHLASLAG